VVTVVLCSWSGRPAGRPDHEQQHDCHHDTKVKPEAATAVVELLMMGGRTPETCWAVNKCQDNKLENCCVWLVIYLNCTMMHGLTNLKLCNNTLISKYFLPSTMKFTCFYPYIVPLYINSTEKCVYVMQFYIIHYLAHLWINMKQIIGQSCWLTPVASLCA
jgi:hypothetical protein